MDNILCKSTRICYDASFNEYHIINIIVTIYNIFLKHHIYIITVVSNIINSHGLSVHQVGVSHDSLTVA